MPISLRSRVLSVLAILFALLMALTLAEPSRASSTAADTVSGYHERLLSAVAAAENAPDEILYQSLAPAMDDAFDFEGMIKTAAGRYWRSADLHLQTQLLAAFRRVSIATYADRFKDVDGQFRTGATRDGPRDLKLVESKLITGDRPVDLTYVLRSKDDGWRIIDVLLDGGISELAVRASQYGAILKEGGIELLIAKLDEQANELLND